MKVTLAGACAGTMADVGAGASCVDKEATLTVVALASLDPDMTLPTASVLVGSFRKEAPCTATPRPPTTSADGMPLYDEEVCVAGGDVIFGSPDSVGNGAQIFDAVPERFARIPPLRVDKYEVTVGTSRAGTSQASLSIRCATRCRRRWRPLRGRSFDRCVVAPG